MPSVLPDSGGDDLTGQYIILPGSGPAVELQGVADVIDVQEVNVQALPSNTIFTLRFRPEAYNPGTVAALASSFAGYFNALSALPGVVGVTTFQDIDGNDQLQDVMRIVVRSTSGNQRFPLEETQFGRRLDYLAPEIAAKVAELDKIEAGH